MLPRAGLGAAEADADEDDYMGDLGRFLGPEHLQPPPERSSVESKRKLSRKEKKRAKDEEMKVSEAEQRSEGLKAAIPSSNIGFKMLQQMGYTPGAALGKHGQGSLEPINVELKTSRTGLGRDDLLRRQEMLRLKVAALEADSKRKREQELKVEFHGRRKGSWQKRKITSDYRKACATLGQLEERQSHGKGAEPSSEEKGCASPGKRKEDGSDEQADAGAGAEVEGEGEGEGEGEEEEISEEQLEEVLTRLRSQFCYCLYCGHQYDSAEAMLANCPGLEEEAH